jgi:hypothetical protein
MICYRLKIVLRNASDTKFKFSALLFSSKIDFYLCQLFYFLGSNRIKTNFTKGKE